MARGGLAAARVDFADDHEHDAVAEEAGDERRRAHELLLAFDLAEVADDADAVRSVGNVAHGPGARGCPSFSERIAPL